MLISPSLSIFLGVERLHPPSLGLLVVALLAARARAHHKPYMATGDADDTKKTGSDIAPIHNACSS